MQDRVGTTMPLDPLYLQMFPTVARYLKRARRERILVVMAGVLSAYVLGRDLLSAYQGRVATENMHDMVGRINNLETVCQKEYPSRTLVTKAQAAVSARQSEEERGGRP